MTNAEKWEKEIIEIARYGYLVAVSQGKPARCCGELYCGDCDLHIYAGGIGKCRTKRLEWFNEEYVEPSIDWRKVEVDTKVLVSADGENWHKGYFKCYENGMIITFAYGATSWSTTDGCDTWWTYAKLAEE